jgi:anti-sigma regulatory factor (Ser/Thr protein kinase)
MAGHSDEIRRFLIEEIDKGNSSSLVRAAGEKFNISRQAVNRHLRQLAAEGIVEGSGNTRNRQYQLKNLAGNLFQFGLSGTLEEDKVWRQNARPLLNDIPENVIGICQYGFTEILNNAIDHSEGQDVFVWVSRTAARATMIIRDNGVGIFNKIKRELKLDDERHAILELSKGKLTTDPARHSGEGVFFVSRAFDKFSIMSGDLFFGSVQTRDYLLDVTETTQGTSVLMDISIFSPRKLKDVFDQYASDQSDYGFSKTHLKVSLARYGDENLVSRSQAKRLLTRLDRFKEINFDFEKVDTIGQAFADEIFRVYQREHPQIVVSWINATAEVTQMIMRARLQS